MSLPRVEYLGEQRFELDRRAVAQLVDDWRRAERWGVTPPGTAEQLFARLAAGEEIQSPQGFRYRGLR